MLNTKLTRKYYNLHNILCQLYLIAVAIENKGGDYENYQASYMAIYHKHITCFIVVLSFVFPNFLRLFFW